VLKLKTISATKLHKDFATFATFAAKHKQKKGTKQ
jgi:hypothetical protein